MVPEMAYTASKLSGLDREVTQETVAVNTTSLEEDLAALQLDSLPRPLMKTPCLHIDAEAPNTSTLTLRENGIGLQPQSHGREQFRASGLPRLDSTTSMKSLITDSGTTTDSCPPSPRSSAHIAEPPRCGSWTLGSSHTGTTDQARGRHVRTPSDTGGERSSMQTTFSFAPSLSSEDDLSHYTSEYGSKVSSTFSSRISAHDFSRFTDEDREQGPSVRDDSYDLLIEAVCNVVTTHFTDNDLRKLKAPVTHYANIFLEHIARDIGDLGTLSTVPVIYQAHGSGDDVPATSMPGASSPSFAAGHESNQGLPSEQNDPDEGVNDDAGSFSSMRMDEHQMSRNVRTNELALSCPYRKRNPIRFNIRSHSSCALSYFPSMIHLKRHIKAFHLNSGEQCHRCGAWFETTEDLFDHLTQLVACEQRGSRNRDPEDGISLALFQKICGKPVQTWNDMWSILFSDLDRDVPHPDFDPPVELDEIESRFYETDAIEGLNQAFKQIALGSPQLSPWEFCQRALKETMVFVASTLQGCRESQGHTPSLGREARTYEFLERVQDLSSKATQLQDWPSGVPAPRSHLFPRGHRQSNDSGIASFPDSDIDIDIPWKLEADSPKIGNAQFPLLGPVSLFKRQNNESNTTNFGLHAAATLETHRFSPNQPRSSDESLDPTMTTKHLSTVHCVCRGRCSWCHTAEFKPSETFVNPWVRQILKSPRIEDDAYPCGETGEEKNPAAWTYCRNLCETPQKHCDQQAGDHTGQDVLAETASTDISTPDSHFSSAEEDYSPTEDVQYEQLVESIANLVVKSRWMGNFEDHCMPIVKFTHAYLENIRSHDDGHGIMRSFPAALASPCADGGDSDPNVGSQEPSGLINANGKREKGASHGHNRNRDKGEEFPNRDNHDDFNDPDNWSRDKKRVRVDDFQKFPCPYRKRHPTRFNVRQYHQCALNTFATMALLKRHIKLFHTPDNRGPSCVRCHRCFQTNEDYKAHLLQADVCEIRSGQDDLQDPEDGLSAEKYEALARRGKSEKVDTWDGLWKLLFPTDQVTPSPHYEEPIELEEVQEKCYNEQSITRFFQRLSQPTHEDGYRYIVKTFKKIRKAFRHLYCDQRRQKDSRFLEEIRKRASTSHACGPPFSKQPSNIQFQESGPTDGCKQLLGVPPGFRKSSTYSVPEMSDTPNTGGSSNDATETSCAMTPASSWHPTTYPSEPPAMLSFSSGGLSQDPSYRRQPEVMKHSGSHSYHEQVSVESSPHRNSFPQHHTTPGFCHHHVGVGTYCEECVEEIAPFFPPGDFNAYLG